MHRLPFQRFVIFTHHIALTSLQTPIPILRRLPPPLFEPVPCWQTYPHLSFPPFPLLFCLFFANNRRPLDELSLRRWCFLTIELEFSTLQSALISLFLGARLIYRRLTECGPPRTLFLGLSSIFFLIFPFLVES